MVFSKIEAFLMSNKSEKRRFNGRTARQHNF